MKRNGLFVLIFLVLSCLGCHKNPKIHHLQLHGNPALVVLGIAQDGGSPQAGDKDRDAWSNPDKQRNATCLAIVDPQDSSRWLIDCTPDFKYQLHFLDELFPVKGKPGLNGIFLTHGHVGHYTGLMLLGREVMGAEAVPVFAMPKMKNFLEQNGPWELLVRLKNIELFPLQADSLVQLNKRIAIKPILVPHRGEYTETVGFIIQGPSKTILFIPDIDKWELLDRWGEPIETLIARVDLAFLDGTFFANGEIPGRDMSEIPHPFIEESLKRFADLPVKEKNKIHFIHLNHTNPAIDMNSEAVEKIELAGFHVAKELSYFIL